MTANKLTLTISGLTSSFFKYSVNQKSDNLSKISIDLTYSTSIQGKTLGMTYSSSRRLQEGRMLTAVSFSSMINVDTYPPAVYYSSSVSSNF